MSITLPYFSSHSALTSSRSSISQSRSVSSAGSNIFLHSTDFEVAVGTFTRNLSSLVNTCLRFRWDCSLHWHCWSSHSWGGRLGSSKLLHELDSRNTVETTSACKFWTHQLAFSLEYAGFDVLPSSKLSGRIMLPPLRCIPVPGPELWLWVCVLGPAEPFSVTRPTRIGLPAISKPFILSSACCASTSFRYLQQSTVSLTWERRVNRHTGQNNSLLTFGSSCRSEGQRRQWVRKAQRSDEGHSRGVRKAEIQHRFGSRAPGCRLGHRNQVDCKRCQQVKLKSEANSKLT